MVNMVNLEKEKLRRQELYKMESFPLFFEEGLGEITENIFKDF